MNKRLDKSDIRELIFTILIFVIAGLVIAVTYALSYFVDFVHDDKINKEKHMAQQEYIAQMAEYSAKQYEDAKIEVIATIRKVYGDNLVEMVDVRATDLQLKKIEDDEELEKETKEAARDRIKYAAESIGQGIDGFSGFEDHGVEGYRIENLTWDERVIFEFIDIWGETKFALDGDNNYSRKYPYLLTFRHENYADCVLWLKTPPGYSKYGYSRIKRFTRIWIYDEINHQVYLLRT